MRASGRGFTLIEVIVLIVVIGVTTAGVLAIFQNTVRRSADPQIYKQALAVAEAMLDEILLSPYENDGPTPGRENFNEVSDYTGYSTVGVNDIKNVPVPGLGDYNVAVAVATATLDDQNAGFPDATDSKRVTVTVTHVPTNVVISLDGYRLKYDAP